MCVLSGKCLICLFSRKPGVGKKKELNHFRLYACNIEINSHSSAESGTNGVGPNGGNSELFGQALRWGRM